MKKLPALTVAAALLAARQGNAQALTPVPLEGPRYAPALPAGPSYAAPPPARYVPALPPQGYAPAAPIHQPPPVRYLEAAPLPLAPAVPLAPVFQQALTVTEAKTALKGLRPGQHQIHFIHPLTNRPVCVALKVSGCVYDVKWHTLFGQHRLVLKVRGLLNDVVVKFKKDGAVVVED